MALTTSALKCHSSDIALTNANHTAIHYFNKSRIENSSTGMAP